MNKAAKILFPPLNIEAVLEHSPISNDDSANGHSTDVSGNNK